MTSFVARSRKAFVAAAGALVSAIGIGFNDGKLDTTDYALAIGFTLLTFGATWWTGNAPALPAKS